MASLLVGHSPTGGGCSLLDASPQANLNATIVKRILLKHTSAATNCARNPHPIRPGCEAG